VADITLKRGDKGRPIVRRLNEVLVDGVTGTSVEQPISLTGATVRLILKDSQTNTTGGGACTVTNASQGEVTYTTTTTDTAQSRVWNMEYEITRSASDIETVPNEGYLTLAIVDDLG
jgi:hypothetical protein